MLTLEKTWTEKASVMIIMWLYAIKIACVQTTRHKKWTNIYSSFELYITDKLL